MECFIDMDCLTGWKDSDKWVGPEIKGLYGPFDYLGRTKKSIKKQIEYCLEDFSGILGLNYEDEDDIEWLKIDNVNYAFDFFKREFRIKKFKFISDSSETLTENDIYEQMVEIVEELREKLIKQHNEIEKRKLAEEREYQKRWAESVLYGDLKEQAEKILGDE